MPRARARLLIAWACARRARSTYHFPSKKAALHAICELTTPLLSVHEKSRIEALDRTQPGLLMKKGRADTMTRDYKRHGVSPLGELPMTLVSINKCPDFFRRFNVCVVA